MMARLMQDASPIGTIRRLRPSEQGLFRDHLLRLDKESRHDRFNGATRDEFIEAYAERCFREGATVVGYVENGRIFGAAELHERPDLDPPTGEIAFSVEKELQHRGLGASLFERLVAHAYALGYTRLRVTTHAQNAAMKALARKFAARLTFDQGETVGVIDLGAPPDDSFMLDPVSVPPRSANWRQRTAETRR